MNEFVDVERAVGLVGSNVDALNAVLNAARERRHAEDRSLIVKSIIILYVVSVGLTILYLICRWDENTYPNILEIIKIAVVPVVTLVMGYYFGSAKI
jgi:hypothetical protein